MGTPQRVLVGIAAALVVLTLVAGVAMGIYVRNAGMVVVQVAERGGCNVDLRIPAAALEIATWVVPDAVLERVGDHVGPWCPDLDPVFDQLGALPDFVLVEAASPGEKVRIETKGGRLIVRAISPTDQVHVSLPIRVAGRILHRIERLSASCGKSASARSTMIST